MNNDSGIGILSDDPVNPGKDILSVEPAHAKVIAICISTGTKIRCQYLIIVSIVVLSQAGCTEMITAVAMQGNYPIMGFAIWIINTIAVNIIFSCDFNRLSRIFSKKSFVCFLLSNFAFCDCTFCIIGCFRNFQGNGSVSTVTGTTNGIIHKIISGKEGDQNK